MDVFDIQLEDFSMLIETPQAYSTMETSLGREAHVQGSCGNDTHIIIVPYMTDIPSEKPPVDAPDANLKTELSPALIEELDSSDSRKAPPNHPHTINSATERTIACSDSVSTTPIPSIVIQPVSDDTVEHEKEKIIEKEGSKHIETTPVSTNESTSRAKNLRELLHTPFLSPNVAVCGRTRRNSLTSMTSDEPAHTTQLHSSKRRHTSEGEAYSMKADVNPLQYTKYSSHSRGMYACDGQNFHLINCVLKSYPDIITSKQDINHEIKQALLDSSALGTFIDFVHNTWLYCIDYFWRLWPPHFVFYSYFHLFPGTEFFRLIIYLMTVMIFYVR